MLKTHTGQFPIAFRRGWSDWQKKDPIALAKWASDNGFAALDLMNVTARDFEILSSHNLGMGSVDLLDFGAIMSADLEKRKQTIAANIQYVKDVAALGAKVFFTCVIPGDHTKSRSENYKLAVECFSPVGEACKSVGATIAIEGWPGGAPHYSTLCCTPETLRPFLKDVPGTSVNYDPSHLIRLGVDHIRFLNEFAPHVKHVHAKDTTRFADAQYEVGSLSPAFLKPHAFGDATWRYCLPGHGEGKWKEIVQVLHASGYSGCVSIELEDENYNGTEAGEKLALTTTRDFLRAL